ncbi:hypothetical protein B296_00038749 [Ensete ventricosum]|uniref:Uncharacterized protein n=1 Tax=Ensete ventricosum TaxID=4639 RepID=A0A426X0C0_ENSVE|nr:hypothetical protein B296_00038749 [Ensete ventricosum]
MVDLTQVRSTPQRSYGQPDIGKVDTLICRRMPHYKDDKRGGRVRGHGADARPDLRCLLLTRAPPLQQPTPVTGYEGSIHLAEHRLRPETTTGELAHKGLNQQCPLSDDGGKPYPLGRHQIWL